MRIPVIACALLASALTPFVTAAQPAPAVADIPYGDIEAFAFDTRPKMGVGGFMTLDIFPVVLFRSGQALTDVTHLADARREGKQWTQWRREGGKLQLQKNGAWKDLPFQKSHAQLPPDYRLQGRFRALSGVGNIATGGSSAVTAVDEYAFEADGRVQRTGAVGSQAGAGDTSVVTSGGPGARPGRYRIEGLRLHIDYADGSREERLLIADPTDPKTAIWLDGKGYSRRR